MSRTAAFLGARLAALVARPRLHLIRFHGVLAPNAKPRPRARRTTSATYIAYLKQHAMAQLAIAATELYI